MRRLTMRRYGIAVLGCAITALMAISSTASASSPITRRASVDSNGGSANSGSVLPSISGDGRFVAFQSSASDLVDGDHNGVTDIYVRDMEARVTIRASVDPAGDDANGASHHPAISADGRYVVFDSSASNLVGTDGNGFDDIFVRDLIGGTTFRASGDVLGSDANEDSFYPAISVDGRYIAFASDASDLVPGDGNGLSDVFVRDVIAGTTVRFSVDLGGGDADGASSFPSVSEDGRVAFESEATDLVTGDDEPHSSDIFVRGPVGPTVRASVDYEGGDADGWSYSPSISTNGRVVAFLSGSSDLVEGEVNNNNNIYVRDLDTESTVRASVDSEGGFPNSQSSDPSISADGAKVAFDSEAGDLVPNSPCRFNCMYVRDLTAQVTVLASPDALGEGPDGYCFDPAISGDGRYAAFWSNATDIVQADGNGVVDDVFVRRLPRRPPW
jgi:Tol biopolymer transport system component